MFKVTKEFTYDNAYHFAKIAKDAYSLEDAFKELYLKCGYINIKYFDRNGAQAYALLKDNYVVLVFRGTEISSYNDVAADLKFFPVKDELGLPGRVHRGFKKEVDDLWDEILEWLSTHNAQHNQVYTCGHSLGAAMSGIAASRIDNAICYNYGCPRIGNASWKKNYNKSSRKFYRFRNDMDIVTTVPLRLMTYRHIGAFYHIQSNGKIVENPTHWQEFKHLTSSLIRPRFWYSVEILNDHRMEEYCECIKNWSNKLKIKEEKRELNPKLILVLIK
jgi:triacylglycerol lipase